MQFELQKQFIGGIDEAGRGPLAGPVVAACVVLPLGYTNSEIKDSKKLSQLKLDFLFDVIKSKALAWHIVSVGNRRIDKVNILQATRLAMKYAVIRTKKNFPLLEGVIIDGNCKIDITLPQQTVVQGDNLHIQVAAASILAKVYRDRLMGILDKKYPGYSLSTHVGYPTRLHKERIKILGASKIHRKTFKGVKEYHLDISQEDKDFFCGNI
jgi:ribonuclease HII